ncbi:MAG: TonB-dependent siderophore receptor [Bradyrhizobiaceae bacterium]|nr:MAG: TonB-dependent siderophore receptor [Bradyrhizobiaceae bacterium]
MTTKIRNVRRGCLLGAASAITLSFAINSPVFAQNAPQAAPNSTVLNPVIVQGDTPKRVKKPAAQRSARMRASGTARGTGRRGDESAAASAGAGQGQTARGHVDGFVATRSGTGTKTDTPLIETPAAISVVTQDQIQAQAAQSVSQAVRYVPGVRVDPAGADARFDQVYIRGFLADKYLDGLKLLTGGFAYNIVDPFNLERIDVLHGPASILYGQASPGGLVDLVSKRPTTDPYHEIFLSTGSYGRIQGGVDLSGPLDQSKEWLYRLTASGFNVGSQVDHTSYERVSIAPSLTWRPDNDTTITFLGTYQNDPKAGFYNQLLPRGIGTVFDSPYGRIPTSFYSGEPNFDQTKREYGSVGYLAEHRFDNVWTVRQNLRYTDNDTYTQLVYPATNQTNPTSIARSAFWTGETLQSFQVDNQAEAKFSTGPFQHTALFGVDYLTGTDSTRGGYSTGNVGSINAFNPVYGISVPPMPLSSSNKQTYDQAGVYTQDQIKFDRWVALLGIRHDQADSRTTNQLSGAETPTSDHATSKRAALLYKFDNGISPYIQYTESFQPIIGASQRTANPFKPTTGKQEEVGIKYQPDSKTLITAAVYELKQQNVVIQDPNDPTNRIQTGEIRSRGVEFEAKSEINRNLTVLASYTYMDLLNTNAAPAALGHRPIGMPANSAAGWADYTFHGGALDGFGISGGVRYIGETYGDTANTYKVPAVTLVDAGLHYDLAGLGRQFKGYNLQVNATNLFDKTYVSVCQDYGCYYGLRREVIATLRYKW